MARGTLFDRMKKVAKILAWSLAGLLLCLSLLFAYLQRADLTIYKPTIERIAADAIGHEFVIGGRFELQVGRLTRLVAEDVRISNADWRDDPALLRIGYLEVVAETMSLAFGPAIFQSLSIDDVEIAVARDARGNINWSVPGRAPADDAGPTEIDTGMFVVQEANLQRFMLRYTDPARAAPLQFVVSEFRVSPDGSGTLDLSLDGDINDVPLGMVGHIGTLDGLIRRKAVEAGLDITLGSLSVSLDGKMQDLGLLRGAETNIRIRGPEIDSLIESLHLPPFATGSFDLDAVVRPDGTWHDLSVTGVIGSANLKVDGRIDDFRHPSDFDVDFDLSGPESEYIAALFGVSDATRAAFAVDGGIQRRGARLAIDDTNIRLGKGRARVHGWVEATGGVPDMDLEFQAQGQNLSSFNPFVPVRGLPAEPFDIDGHVRKQGGTWQIERLVAAVGDVRMTGDGELAPRGTEQSRIEIRAAGPRISVLRGITGLEGLPDAPFDVRVDLRTERGGIRLHEANGTFGEIEASLSGWINPDDEFVGTDVGLRVSGRSFGDLISPDVLPELPRSAFDLEGHAGVERDTIQISALSLRTGDLRAEATGQLRRHKKTLSISADLKLAVSDIAHYFPDTPLQRVAASPLSVAAHVDTADSALTLRNIRAELGDLSVVADGEATLREARLDAADFTLRVRAPDVRLVSSLVALPDLPPGPFSVDGAVSITKTAIDIRDTRVAIGEHALQLSGVLSLDRPYSGNDLTLELSGPDARAAAMAGGYDLFAPAPYHLFISMNGTQTGLSSDEIRIDIGESHGGGNLDIEIGGELPVVRVALHARQLDLRPIEKRWQAAQQERQQAESNSKTTEPTGDRRVFSSEPIDVPWLDAAYVDARLTADHVFAEGRDVRNLVFAMRLEPGRFDIERLQFEQAGGTGSATLSLERVEAGYDISTQIRIAGAHPVFVSAPGQDRATIPAFNVDLDLRGSGRSMAEVAASANGHAFLFVDEGRILMPRFDLIFNDFVTTVTRAINPLAEKSPYTALNCGLLDTTVVNGKATIENFAFQSDVLRVLSTGTINLATEQIDLGFHSQPRQGIGVSVSSVTNSLLRVGGTLGKPTLAIDAAGTAKKTGFAIATAGISLLAAGLFDRLDAEADMCPTLPRSPQEARARP